MSSFIDIDVAPSNNWSFSNTIIGDVTFYLYGANNGMYLGNSGSSSNAFFISTPSYATLRSTNVNISSNILLATNGTAAAPVITWSNDTDTGIYHPNSNQIAFSTLGTNALFINSNQNVGIGITNPQYKLDVLGNINIKNGNTTGAFTLDQILFEFSGNTYRHAIKTRHDSATSGNNSIDFYLWRNGQSATAVGDRQVMSVTATGVGIGITAPTCALHVVSSASLPSTVNGTTSAYYFNGSTSTLFNTTSWGGNWSIRANDHIGANGFVAVSDNRIKKDINNIDTNFEKLLQLRPVTYRHKDILKSQGIKYGFIAQEVQKIFPDTVYKSDDFIPDIFVIKKCIGKIIILEENDFNLNVGDKIRLIHKNSIIEDVNIISITQNKIEVDMKNDIFDDIFIYGRYVTDHLNLDYNHIMSYSIKHLQELYKIVINQGKLIDQLSIEISLLKNKSADTTK